ncbi:hypothetical protein [Azospirillum sp. TSA6c]|uniref:hypothetical protein n=1 Tax=Azospirillum sp. TSA6c TaxID=709813 RepID=UPI0011B54611|nr:hypothetical protein [Azospirillum sp. TSA6c]
MAVVMVLIGVGEARAANFDCAIYREDAVTLPQGSDTPPQSSTARARAAELCAKHFAVRLAADPAAKGTASLADTYVVSVGPKDGNAAALKAATAPLFSAGVDTVERDLKDVDFQGVQPSPAPAQSTFLVPPGANQQPSIGGPLPTAPRPRFLDPPGVRANGQSLYRMRLERGRQ